MTKTIIAVIFAFLALSAGAGNKAPRAPFKVDGLWCYGMTITPEQSKEPYRRAFVSKKFPHNYLVDDFAHSQGEEYVRYDVSGNLWLAWGTSPAFLTQHKVAGEKCFKHLFPDAIRKYQFD